MNKKDIGRQIMIHLRSVSINSFKTNSDSFPFNIPIFQNLDELAFTAPVTILVGENGSGKSTLLEGIAKAAGLITVGSEDVDRDPTLLAIQPLVDALKLVWTMRIRRGFFLRAEDFFGYIKRQRALRQSMADEIKLIDRDFGDRSDYAKSLAKGPAISSLQSLDRRYGADLDAQSHGESFLTLFKSRLVPGGLYLLDEPEAALSPLSQLGFISLVNEMVSKESQFIIASHSPILMAISDALILNFDQIQISPVNYDDLAHVKLFRSFLDDPQAFMRHL